VRILLLGASGLVGSAFQEVFNEYSNFNVTSIVRHPSDVFFSSSKHNVKIIPDIVEDESLRSIFLVIQPEVVINCIGIIKSGASKKMTQINELFPHKLYKECMLFNARLIHISTDCVFSGVDGNYSENDVPSPIDEYGASKLNGEVYGSNAVTIRTSFIGHEYKSSNGLLEWFLSQKDSCTGYNNAIFSGFPSIIFAKIIIDHVISNNSITGLYHVSSQPISKFALLKIIAEVYKKKIKIEKDESFVINRSLDSSKFKSLTEFSALDWEASIKLMHKYKYINT